MVEQDAFIISSCISIFAEPDLKKLVTKLCVAFGFAPEGEEYRMADLDDFFAKKDRKKAKGKKFTTADEIAKKLEETGKKVEKSKKEKAAISSQVSGQGEEEQGNQAQEDDEWKEFEEEKKDYTGLKIGNLHIEGEGVGGEGDEEDDQEMEENEAGELVPKRKVQSGPWKMVKQPQPTATEVSESQVVEKRPEGPTGSSSYVPPHLRNQPKEPSHANPRSKSKAAPDINSEEYFPSLFAAKSTEPAGAWGRRRRDEGNFEEVRNSKSHSSRYSDIATKMSASGAGPKLNLGNKYGPLSPEQS
ncbi:protein CDV3 homolog [Zootermopsis nevadensis]|uniref:protein CDV3 homolog n=1 Tax=Zootermopsis nevadensis TaxID=136037 RepID=UPI000B8E4618|nr:protein CDV3 homolog [Zootermopsis nevadensis]